MKHYLYQASNSTNVKLVCIDATCKRGLAAMCEEDLGTGYSAELGAGAQSSPFVMFAPATCLALRTPAITPP